MVLIVVIKKRKFCSQRSGCVVLLHRGNRSWSSCHYSPNCLNAVSIKLEGATEPVNHQGEVLDCGESRSNIRQDQTLMQPWGRAMRNKKQRHIFLELWQRVIIIKCQDYSVFKGERLHYNITQPSHMTKKWLYNLWSIYIHHWRIQNLQADSKLASHTGISAALNSKSSNYKKVIGGLKFIWIVSYCLSNVSVKLRVWFWFYALSEMFDRDPRVL